MPDPPVSKTTTIDGADVSTPNDVMGNDMPSDADMASLDTNANLGPAPVAPQQAPQTPATVGGEVQSGTPTPSVPSPTFTQEQYDTLVKQNEDFGAMAKALQEQGIRTQSDLTQRFAAQTPDQLKALIQEALGTQTTPAAPKTPVTPAGPMDSDQIKDLIQKSFAERDTQQADHQYLMAASTEAELKARVLNDPRFKSITQGATFEESWKGEKGGAAQMLALAVDHFMYQRGLLGPDGAYRPVTDPAAVSEISSKLAGLVNNLRAATLHELSTEPTGIAPPDAPAVPPVDVQIDAGEQWGFMTEEDAAQRRLQDTAVRATYEQTVRAIQAQEQMAPASAGF